MLTNENGKKLDDITNTQVRIGEKLLVALEAKAKKSPYQGSEKLMPLFRVSALQASNLGSSIRLNNLKSIVVREDALGGWYADICLKKVPEGLPNTIGSPALPPLSSKREAHDWAYEFVRDVHLIEALLETGRPGLNDFTGRDTA